MRKLSFMKMVAALLVGLVAGSLCGVENRAEGAVVASGNFVSSASSSTQRNMEGAGTAGLYPVAGADWVNLVSADLDGADPGTVWGATGVSLGGGITASWSVLHGLGLQQTGNLTASQNDVLFNSGVQARSTDIAGGVNASMTLNGLSSINGAYDIIVYFTSPGQGLQFGPLERGYVELVGGSKYFVGGYTTWGHAGNQFVLSTNTIDNPPPPFPDPYTPTLANYVRFDGLTGDSQTIDWRGITSNPGNRAGRLSVVGFQIVEAIPEPSGIALVGMAFAALGLMRRRK